MWAQDTATMTSYLIASRAASDLAPFTQPDHETAPDGAAQQEAGTSLGLSPRFGSLDHWAGRHHEPVQQFQ